MISIEVPSQQFLGTEETDKNRSQDRRERHQEVKRKLPAYNFTDYYFMWLVYMGRIYTSYEGWNFNSGNYLFTTDTK